MHLGRVAVADADGRLVAGLGDPLHPVFLRSATKPVQAAVSLSLLDGDLPERLVAALCGSHNGEPVHVAATRALLRRGALGVSALRGARRRCRSTAPRCSRPGARGGSSTTARPSTPAWRSRARAGTDAGDVPGALAPAPAARAPRRPPRHRDRSAEDGRRRLRGCRFTGDAARGGGDAVRQAAASERFGRLGPSVDRAVRAMRADPYLVAGADGRTPP